MNCKHASQLISQSLDRDLSRGKRFSLKFHLLICKNCNRFSQQLHGLCVTIKRIREHVEDDETIVLPTDSKKRIEQSIDIKN